jgi:hypothetical protein
MALRTCRIAAGLVLACSSTPSLAQTPSPPPACTGPEHRQFDFWLGHWDVYPTGKDKLVAHSLIEKLYAGCTVRENWMPLSGNNGGSLNMYDPSDRRWHQTWQDSQNSRAEFDGGMVKDKMVLTGFWRGVLGPGDAWIRIEWSRNPDGSVRQHGCQSTDHGRTWEASFDFTYRKSAPAAAK